MITLDNGKPISESIIEVGRTADTFRYYAGWATKFYGETNPSDPGIFNYTLREPIGVCGQIIPWNGPLATISWKIAPALAFGNTLVLKPAEQTPLPAIRLGELICEAGVPDGVVNIVTGFGPTAGGAIAAHPDIDKVAFTGSTEVGKLILQASAGNLKRVSLELGGKSPNVIFPDAPMEQAVALSATGVFRNQGQVCCAATRMFVQERIYDEFAERISAKANEINLGQPLNPATTMGPLVSSEQHERVLGYLKLAHDEGAKAKAGGERGPQEKGYFVKPTIYTDVKNEMRIAREEIFGPVAVLIPFKDENDAVLQGNDTTYGLGAGVWTQDVSRAHKVARALKAGSVWVNCYGIIDPISPFGGYKAVGVRPRAGPALDRSLYPDQIGLREALRLQFVGSTPTVRSKTNNSTILRRRKKWQQQFHQSKRRLRVLARARCWDFSGSPNNCSSAASGYRPSRAKPSRLSIRLTRKFWRWWPRATRPTSTKR